VDLSKVSLRTTRVHLRSMSILGFLMTVRKAWSEGSISRRSTKVYLPYRQQGHLRTPKGHLEGI